ncbi:YtzI protein [Allobacillus sp. GCM10007491]|uniref:YtzI protein n=1 Tax=Allobacillus saliphilus TaxID=2912308 RepID=A0A941CVJ4_9BACI|nr:YtzI protein [Allobacillus saliphilus]MBR7554777.1 YtzI protein [Allobacillus saliphilus]
MTIIYTMAIGLVIFIAVLAVTLKAISKGYNYKHEVDPLPEANRNERS